MQVGERRSCARSLPRAREIEHGGLETTEACAHQLGLAPSVTFSSPFSSKDLLRRCQTLLESDHPEGLLDDPKHPICKA